MLLQKWLLTIGTQATSPQQYADLLYVYGYNLYGQLGENDIIAETLPTQLDPRSWAQIATGSNHTLAIRSDSYLFTWGENDTGQLGDKTLINKSSPVQLGGGFWKSVAARNNTSYGIRSNGKLYTWGQSSNGELGIDDFATPSLAKSWSMVSLGDSHVMALRSDGMLFSWGNGVNGQLGLNDRNHRSSQVQIGTSSWIYITAGSGYSAAIRADGTLFAWGQNSANATIGDNTIIPRSSPVQIGTSSWSIVKAGSVQTLGLTIDGTLYAWGTGTTGQLGQGVVVSRSSPVQVTSLLSESDIESYAAFEGINPYPTSWSIVKSGQGSGATLALQPDGSLWAWGFNSYGELGIDSTRNQSSPSLVSSNSWTQISVAGDAATIGFVLGLKSDGTLWAWGNNTNGQLGLEDVIPRSSPVQVGTSSWSVISAGSNNSYLIRTDGALFACGVNNSGQLGDSTLVHRSSPVQIGTDSWTSVNGGTSSASAIRSDGLLFTWGINTVGGIGDGSLVNRSSPVQVTSLSNQDDEQSYATDIGYTIVNQSWSQIKVGPFHTVAIRSDGLLFSWGTNAFGQLGNDSTMSMSSPVPIGTSSWTSVSISESHTAAIRIDGALFSWGINTGGQLGLADNINRSSPVQVGTQSWSKVSSGSDVNLGITSDGLLYTWGINTTGGLGLNDRIHRSSPTQLGTNSWSSTSAGDTMVGITSDGILFAWGDSSQGGIGQGLIVARSSPVQVTSIAGNEAEIDKYVTAIGYAGTVYYSWSMIAISTVSTYAIRSDGMLFAWGANESGQLGNNTTIAESSPIMIGTSSWLQVGAGSQASTTINYATALRADGAIFTWGNGASGVLGLGDIISRSSPVQVGTSSWNQVSAGEANILALRTDGALYVWGGGLSGRLGTNDSINRSSPVQLGTSSWTQVSAGGSVTAAIRSDGGLFTWGLGTSGALGSNNILSRSSPVQVGTSSWVQVSAAQMSMYAIRLGGSLFVWGSGDRGRTGLNSTIHRSSPVQLGTSSWSVVSGGDQEAYAIRSDGVLFAWGINDKGQIGDNTVITRSSPVQVGSSSWTTVKTATNSGAIVSTVVAIRSDGRLFVWGNNNNSQLGNMRFNDQSSPVVVATINDSWSVVSAALHTLAIRSDNLLFTWGLGTSGQLGAGTAISRSAPVQVGSSSWINVTAGISSSYAIRSDNSLFAWGNGLLGQIGDSTLINKSSPIQIGTSSWTVIGSRNSQSAAAIRDDGLLFIWGSGVNGQIGNYRLSNYSSPVQLATMNDSWTSVSSGNLFTSAIRSDGLLYTWGVNTSGQLGSGNIVHRSAPMQVGTDSWVTVSAGSSHMAALRNDYSLYTWGLNASGQLGLTDNANRSSPVQVGTSLSDGYYSNFFTGSNSYLTVPNNAAFNFGSNDFTIEAYIFPTVVVGENLIASLYGYTFNRRSWYFGIDGSILEFRSDDNGTGAVVVNGNTTLTPNQWYHVAVVKTGSTANIYLNGILDGSGTAVATLYNNTVDPVLIGADGPDLVGYFAGNISNLRILNGTALYTSNFTPSTTPLTAITNTVLLTCQSSVLVDNSVNNFPITNINTTISVNRPFDPTSGGTAWASVTTGLNYTGAVNTTNKLYMWGDNQYGQLGVVRLNNMSSPVIVKGIADHWSTASSGSSHAVALRNDAQLYSWGANAAGQLGDNTLVAKSVPTVIGAASLPNGYYSVSFNGVDDYLQIANATPLIFGTGDLTVEAWIYTTAFGIYRAIYSKYGSTTASGTFLFGTNPSGNLYVDYNGSGFLASSTILPLNTWTHVAWSRSSGTTYLFINGTLDASKADTTNLSGAAEVRIGLGRGPTPQSFWSGNISNLRVIKGTGLYTSNFTPMGPLTAITNTVLLTCQSPTLKDNSINNYTITNY